MFRRKRKAGEINTSPAVPEAPPENADLPSLPPLRRGLPMNDAKPSTVPLRPDLPRRLPDPPVAATQMRRPTTPAVPPPKPESGDAKRLIVGRDISLTGEITACGIFKGKAEIDSAEIAGRYEGELTVRDRLYVRSTGKVVGSVRYGRLEIECGGEIVGDVQTLSRAQPASLSEPAPVSETRASEPSLLARGIAD
jgi:cytoskeletal protein CcmA (bactofilin family)